MPNVRQLKRRIRSVENTSKITKVMSMIAASKMRRAQEAAVHGRPYADHMRVLHADLSAQLQFEDEENLHPLMQSREVKNVEIVLITPDRGLTGGLNSNINREAAQFLVGQSNNGGHTSVIAVGKKGRDFMVRSGQDVRAVFIDLPDRASLTDITPAAHLVTEAYAERRIDAAFVVYAQFVNTTLQRPVVEPLLPVVPAELRPQDAVGYIYEPNREDVLSDLLPRFVEMQLYHALLEGIASEQSARMVAMRNATDSADEMVSDLTLVMNKVRQESITAELLDIVGGAAAVQS